MIKEDFKMPVDLLESSDLYENFKIIFKYINDYFVSLNEIPNTKSAIITCDGVSPVVDDEYNDKWISSIEYNYAGDYTINFKEGVFNRTPVLQCEWISDTVYSGSSYVFGLSLVDASKESVRVIRSYYYSGSIYRGLDTGTLHITAIS